jgi:hypothetical protein
MLTSIFAHGDWCESENRSYPGIYDLGYEAKIERATRAYIINALASGVIMISVSLGVWGILSV